MVESHGAMGWSSGPAQKAKSFEKETEYCQKLHEVMEAISSEEQPGGFGKLASGEVQFRCVDAAAQK